MRPPTLAEVQLIAWLQRLVQLLLAQEGSARQLSRVVAGRRAVLVLDEARLSLHADAGEPLTVCIEPAAPDELPHVRTTADTLRDVMNGRALLDTTVADGRLFVRAQLHDLLAFHELVLHALSFGTRHAGLQALWAEFDQSWPGECPRCAALDGQRAVFGALRQAVPAAVQMARSPLEAHPLQP
ncbi:hypothetical protein [Roseateles sp.]|uniref:hypothetical protein n=1 Tax=Roseateles sp. TaxID=1971397 RepID=UPI0039EBE739